TVAARRRVRWSRCRRRRTSGRPGLPQLVERMAEKHVAADRADPREALLAEELDVVGRAGEDGRAAAGLVRQLDLRPDPAPEGGLRERRLEPLVADVVREREDRRRFPEEADERRLRGELLCRDTGEENDVALAPARRHASHVL